MTKKISSVKTQLAKTRAAKAATKKKIAGGATKKVKLAEQAAASRVAAAKKKAQEQIDQANEEANLAIAKAKGEKAAMERKVKANRIKTDDEIEEAS